MALRVLLGDESSTIKKVFQLALQDFAVEVRPVNIGVDVVTVATSFKPDIIFMDVLLQKKNGYDVSHDLKQDAALKDIPVVLMWSGFMELDEDKFQASMANAQLEKPFDVTALRRLVTDLVPRTNSQRLSQFLAFPKMPDLEEKAPPPVPEEPAPPEDNFRQVSIPKMKNAQDGKFRLNMKPEELDPSDMPVEYHVPADSAVREHTSISLGESDDEDDEFSLRDARSIRPPATPPARAARTAAPVVHEELEVEDLVEESVGASDDSPALAVRGQLSPEQLERIIREQSAEVIESVVWKVIPEMAAQIIERELNKLLKERDANSY